MCIRDSDCRPCAFTAWKFLLSSFLFIGVTVALVITKIKDGKRSLVSSLLRLIINHNSYLTAILAQTEAVKSFKEVFEREKEVTGAMEEIFSADCVLRSIFNRENQYIASFAYAFVTTFVFIIVCTFLFTWKKQFELRSKLKSKEIGQATEEECNGLKELTKFSKIILCVFLIVFFTSYSYLTKQTISMVVCVKLENGATDTFLRLDPSKPCWKGAHQRYIYYAFLPAMIFCVIGIPFSLFILMWKIRRLQSLAAEDGGDSLTNNSPEPNGPDSITRLRAGSTAAVVIEGRVYQLNFQQRTIMRFAGDYKDQYYFWESVIYLRKFLMVLVEELSVMVSTNLHSALMLTLQIIFFLINSKLQPFRFEILNRLENLSFFAVISTIAALMALTGRNGNSHSTHEFWDTLMGVIMLGMMVGTNLIFLVTWCQAMVSSDWSSHFLVKLFTKPIWKKIFCFWRKSADSPPVTTIKAQSQQSQQQQQQQCKRFRRCMQETQTVYLSLIHI
eukprot:TRINITY_DN13719_c0_g1_i1.p1 TRINITY_DN13719_c0_g1~~TRINITY_DN13719_c0_g1_i1.p1  ORF type:complete len:519 (-),score=109.57 TRINITY_DN13719_c0_g1_i1:59-1567(-)